MSETIAQDLIDPSPTQPRTIFRRIEELAASIKAVGQQRPVTLRRGTGKRSSRYELVDGERRWRAAKLLGWTHLTAEVVEMTDEQVIKAQLAANDSEPLTPIEEGSVFRRLIDTCGKTADEVALDLGIAKSTVFARIRLTYLIPPLRALVDAERLSQVSAQLIALEPDDVQELIADDIRTLYPSPAGKLTRDDVRNLVDRHVRRLEHAPFDRTSATLTAAGSCEGCPQSTATQRSLLEDGAEEALCTKRECWDEKVEAAWQLRTEDAERVSLPVLTNEQAAMILDGGRVRPGAKWVNVDESIAPGEMKTWRELEHDLSEQDQNGQGYDLEQCALARSGDRFVTLLAAPYAAVYLEPFGYEDRVRELRGLKPQGMVDDAEEKKAAKDKKLADAELHLAAIARLGDSLRVEPKNEKERRTREKRDLLDLKLDVVMTGHCAGVDAMKAIASMLGLPLKESDRTPITPQEALARWAADAEVSELAIVRRQLTAYAHVSDPSAPPKPIESLLDAHEVSLPALRKELARAKRNVKSRAKKVSSEDAVADGGAL